MIGVLLDLFNEAEGFQIGHDLLAGLMARHALIRAAVLVDSGVFVEDSDKRQTVFLARGKVVRVMRRRHLDDAGPKLGVNEFVPDHGELAIH